MDRISILVGINICDPSDTEDAQTVDRIFQEGQLVETEFRSSFQFLLYSL